MKIVSVISAVLVCVALYLFVFERDTLRGQPETETAASAEGQGDASDEPDAPADPSRRVVSVVAQRTEATTVDSVVVLRGRTEPIREVSVFGETSGRVVSNPLRAGTVVEAGQVLCQLDPGTRPAQLAEARARLAEAEINFNAAEGLAAGGFGSETRKIAAEAALEAARAQVLLVETDIGYLQVTAPFGGVLETDTAELGALLSSMSGEHCATVLQLDPVKVVGFVAETQVSNVSVGAQAAARLADGREAVGRVTFLSRQADEVTRTFRVEIEVDNPGLTIRAGQTAEIAVASVGEVAHLLPASALTLNDQGDLGVRHVVTGDNGPEAAFAKVTLLRDTIDGVWISGLPETAEVIVVGQDFVTAGTPLKVTLRDGPS